MQIQIKIASTEQTDDCTFIVKQTTAPVEYDGFGTFTIYEWNSGPTKADNFRIVLIREEHAQWQLARYSSGLHTACDADIITGREVAEILWKRIAEKEIGHS
jgi:hypothetical protein